MTYRGTDVFAQPAARLVELVAQDGPYDPDDPELGYSYIFPHLELALWRPVLPEGEEDPEGRYFSTIGVGRPGYFSAR